MVASEKGSVVRSRRHGKVFVLARPARSNERAGLLLTYLTISSPCPGFIIPQYPVHPSFLIRFSASSRLTHPGDPFSLPTSFGSSPFLHTHRASKAIPACCSGESLSGVGDAEGWMRRRERWEGWERACESVYFRRREERSAVV